MTLSLEVDRTAWNRHVDGVAGRVAGLVPVVKGNGYGLGRRWLADRASRLADTVAVGTVHELADVPQGVTPVVLTPALDLTTVARPDAILTVGSPAHVAALGRTARRVVVKVRSSMMTVMSGPVPGAKPPVEPGEVFEPVGPVGQFALPAPAPVINLTRATAFRNCCRSIGSSGALSGIPVWNIDSTVRRSVASIARPDSGSKRPDTQNMPS